MLAMGGERLWDISSSHTRSAPRARTRPNPSFEHPLVRYPFLCFVFLLLSLRFFVLAQKCEKSDAAVTKRAG